MFLHTVLDFAATQAAAQSTPSRVPRKAITGNPAAPKGVTYVPNLVDPEPNHLRRRSGPAAGRLLSSPYKKTSAHPQEPRSWSRVEQNSRARNWKPVSSTLAIEECRNDMWRLLLRQHFCFFCRERRKNGVTLISVPSLFFILRPRTWTTLTSIRRKTR